jgi:uncharacterized RDD family membrane protein YckC
MDPQQGIICGLTAKSATFENSCPTFVAEAGKELANPYEATTIDPELTMATGTRRFLNHIIDSVIYYLLAIISTVVIIILFELFYPGKISLSEDSTPWWIYVIGIIIYLSYYTFCESVFGRTVGKLITGTRVVNKYGKTPDTKTILLRSLSRLVPFEPFSFLGSEPRGWHDMWTNTYVVDNH